MYAETDENHVFSYLSRFAAREPVGREAKRGLDKVAIGHFIDSLSLPLKRGSVFTKEAGLRPPLAPAHRHFGSGAWAGQAGLFLHIAPKIFSGMIDILILSLTALCAAYLIVERQLCVKRRRACKHVIYVNGTRGKSTVTRLIDAGLRAGGFRVFCKTTGTLPMIIGVDGEERPLKRRGAANIREQLDMLRDGARQGADVLVIECMAVDPGLQWISQHRMLQADIGVITNVRLDHRAEMGNSLEEICDALCNTIPKGGRLFTGDRDFYAQIRRNAEKLGSHVILAEPEGAAPGDMFPENRALALAVCGALGVERDTAQRGMEAYRPDPYAFSVHRFPGGALFINAFSANDPDSTELIFRRAAERYGISGRRLIALINNRPDRGYRTEDMLALAGRLKPYSIWLCGASRGFMRLRLSPPPGGIRSLRGPEQAPFAQLQENDLVFAMGNIAGPGMGIMERVEKETEPYVQ